MIDTLWTQGQLKTKMYSVHLTRYPEDASTLTLGGPNNEQSSGGNLTYFPVTEQALVRRSAVILCAAVLTSNSGRSERPQSS